MSNRISIVTPSFNQVDFIERTIRSVLNQGYDNLEYIIVDGGSTDGTVEILKKYGGKIKWISEKDNGQTEAINKGMRMVTGEIMAYLNSDDTYEKNTFNIVAKYFEGKPRAMIVYGKGRYVDKNDKYIGDYPTDGVSFDILKNKCPICQPGVFWRRKLMNDIGLFDESLKYGMDYDYWIRTAKKFEFNYIDKYLANYRLHDQAKTVGQAVKMAEEQMIVCKKYYGEIGDRWILNYVNHKINSGRLDNLMKIIPTSFVEIIKRNKRLPKMDTWRIYLSWIKESFIVSSKLS